MRLKKFSLFIQSADLPTFSLFMSGYPGHEQRAVVMEETWIQLIKESGLEQLSVSQFSTWNPKALLLMLPFKDTSALFSGRNQGIGCA